MQIRNLSGKRIKLASVAQDMKQADLRAALSVDHNVEISQAALSDLERSKRSITDIELDAFAKVLDVNPMWLLYGDDLPKFNAPPLKSR